MVGGPIYIGSLDLENMDFSNFTPTSKFWALIPALAGLGFREKKVPTCPWGGPPRGGGEFPPTEFIRRGTSRPDVRRSAHRGWLLFERIPYEPIPLYDPVTTPEGVSLEPEFL